MTSERFSFDQPDWPEFLFHMQRYALAAHYAKGKDVLDCASGEGYGSAFLARTARRVIGVDIAEHAVNACNRKYDLSNCSFQVGSIAKLEQDDRSFDLVTCFETLEHVNHEDQMLALKELSRVLKPSGKLLISTPDKNSGIARKYFNPYHLNELTLKEFGDLLSSHFKSVKIYSQEINTATAMWPLEDESARSSPTWIDQCEVLSPGHVAPRCGNIGHYYLLAICSNASVTAPKAHFFSSFKREASEALWSEIGRLSAQVNEMQSSQDTEALEIERGLGGGLLQRKDEGIEMEILRQLSVTRDFMERMLLEEREQNIQKTSRVSELELLMRQRDEFFASSQREVSKEIAQLREKLASVADERDASQALLAEATRNSDAILVELTARDASEHERATQASKLISDLHAEVDQLRTAIEQKNLEFDDIIAKKSTFKESLSEEDGKNNASRIGLNESFWQDLKHNRDFSSAIARSSLKNKENATSDEQFLSIEEVKLAFEQLLISERNCVLLQQALEKQSAELHARPAALSMEASLPATICNSNADGLALVVDPTFDDARTGRDALLEQSWHVLVWKKVWESIATDRGAAISALAAIAAKRNKNRFIVRAGDSPSIQLRKIANELRAKAANITDDAIDHKIVECSGLFSADWYLRAYPDVAAAGMDAAQHYCIYGGREQREPGPAFAAADYMARYDDVREQNCNPLVHFVRFGFLEGRWQANHEEMHKVCITMLRGYDFLHKDIWK